MLFLMYKIYEMIYVIHDDGIFLGSSPDLCAFEIFFFVNYTCAQGVEANGYEMHLAFHACFSTQCCTSNESNSFSILRLKCTSYVSVSHGSATSGSADFIQHPCPSRPEWRYS